MACTHYSVCLDDSSGWIARLDARVAGPYVTRDMALRVAVAEAGKLRADGHAICIVVADANGEVCAARCICARFEEYLSARTA